MCLSNTLSDDLKRDMKRSLMTPRDMRKMRKLVVGIIITIFFLGVLGYVGYYTRSVPGRVERVRMEIEEELILLGFEIREGVGIEGVPVGVVFDNMELFIEKSTKSDFPNVIYFDGDIEYVIYSDDFSMSYAYIDKDLSTRGAAGGFFAFLLILLLGFVVIIGPWRDWYNS